jgi:hypothetical protein
VNTTLSEFGRHRLLRPRLSNPQSPQRTVKVTGVSESQASIQHPPTRIHVLGVYRRCSHPTHSGTNGITVVMSLNQCDPGVCIHNAGVLWKPLDEFFE